MCHYIDYSGLEGTKGGASVIRRYFADEEAGCDVVEEEEEGDGKRSEYILEVFNFVKLSE